MVYLSDIPENLRNHIICDPGYYVELTKNDQNKVFEFIMKEVPESQQTTIKGLPILVYNDLQLGTRLYK